MKGEILKNEKVNVKVILAALWTVIMMLYIYNDIFSLFKPGVLDEMISGRMGPFAVSQGGLFSAALLMAIPACMIFASLVMPPKVSRIVSTVLSGIYIVVMVISLIGEWYFYMFMGILEIACNVLIIVYALTWPKSVEPANG